MGKHGVVRNDNKTTFYGSAATQYMAEQSATYCDTQKEAEAKVQSAKGEYRQALIAALRFHGFVFDDGWLDKLAVEEAAEEVAAAKSRRNNRRALAREYSLNDKPTSAKCALCKRSFKKTETYYDGGRGARWHRPCAEADE